MRQRYEVHLSSEERELCRAVMANPEVASTVRRRAGILFHCDAREPLSSPDGTVAHVLGIDERTVRRVRTAFVNVGFERALWGPVLHPVPIGKISPRDEARLLILSATPPPPSYPRWTVRTLADEIHSFAGLPDVSRELVRRILNRHKQTANAQPLGREEASRVQPV